MNPQEQHFTTALDILDDFFDRLDVGRLTGKLPGNLLRQKNPIASDHLRQRIRQALFTVLLDMRPRLEASRGLAWPYDALERNAPFLETMARKGPSSGERLQARLYLALLPFPGQWKHLLDLSSRREHHPEIAALLAGEQRRIVDKLTRKQQKTFKLRHFCQVLKSPRLPAEKGVLRIFSLPYLFNIPNLLKRLGRSYFIYLEPPWGVLARHAWLRVFSDLEDPCLIGAGGPEDRRFLETQQGIVAVPLAHGDYLEEDAAVPLTKKKEIDIVFNGLFDDMPRKRHALLLDMLCRPELSRLTALFIGRGNPVNVAAFRNMVAVRGLEGRVAVHDNLPRRDVPKYLARCRLGVQLSLHENVCRSIYEFFRQDIPCLLSSSMAGFNFELITSRTGAVARDSRLSEAILDLLAHIDRCAPRRWFLGHSGSTHSSRRLNTYIRKIFLRQGYTWEEDIVPLGSSGPNRYTDASHYQRFLPAFAELYVIFQQFPLPIRLAPE